MDNAEEILIVKVELALPELLFINSWFRYTKHHHIHQLSGIKEALPINALSYSHDRKHYDSAVGQSEHMSEAAEFYESIC